MSYIVKKGKAAAESATAEKQDVSTALVSFKSGSAYKVRVASDEDFVEYFAASVFKVFNTTPVEPDSLYHQAVNMLYDDARAAEQAGDEDKAQELRDQAYQLKPKPRYLFGFINLADGQPIIVDVSKAQAKVLIASIEKNAKKLARKPFELAKDGQGTSTMVSLITLDEEDLTDKEAQVFADTADASVPDDLYGQVLYVKDESEQLADLQAFGFDTARLGAGQATNAGQADSADDPTQAF